LKRNSIVSGVYWQALLRLITAARLAKDLVAVGQDNCAIQG
jgi:hypothetical protein